VLGAGCAVGAIVFGGIVAAIFIPNFLEALQKAKQKRTMADLRVWGAVLEDYRLEHDGEVPAAGTVEELAGVLGLDGADTPATTDTYRLVSAGRDGVFENEDPALYEPGTFRLVDFDADLVVQDGAFVRYPGPAR
jgi:type II secretory pathway pseudopilin PulG